MKNVIIATLVVAMSTAECFAFSKSSAKAKGEQTGNQVGSQLGGDTEKTNAVSTTGYNTLQKSAADNLNNSQKGKSTGMILAGGLAGAAAAYFGVCSGTAAVAYAACIAGGVLIGMSMQSKKAADSFNGPIADSWSNLCEFKSGGCLTPTPPDPYKPVVNNSPQLTQPQIDKAKEILLGKGIDFDPITGNLKTKDGKTIDPSNPASIEAAIGAEAAGALMNQVADAEKAALAKVEMVKPLSLAAMGFEGGGGGGGVGTDAAAGYEDAAGAAGLGAGLGGKGMGLGTRRKPAQVSGLSKNFNGDPIGVAADSIFMMMSRRYNLKNTQKTFFAPDFK